jgi:hypothetical protein
LFYNNTTKILGGGGGGVNRIIMLLVMLINIRGYVGKKVFGKNLEHVIHRSCNSKDITLAFNWTD